MSVREILERQDFEAFASALAPDVVWVGVLPGQLCRTREQVVETFREALDAGVRASPEILAASDDAIVVDFHPQPAPELVPELHQIFVLREGEVVELRDYADRESALDAYRRMLELQESE